MTNTPEADGHKIMTATDWLWAGGGLLFGAFAGLVMSSMAVLMYQGLWVLMLLVLPLFLVQLLFEATINGLWRHWRRWRGYPPPTPVPSSPVLPLPRRFAFLVGFCLGAAYGFFCCAVTPSRSVGITPFVSIRNMIPFSLVPREGDIAVVINS